MEVLPEKGIMNVPFTAISEEKQQLWKIMCLFFQMTRQLHVNEHLNQHSVLLTR